MHPAHLGDPQVVRILAAVRQLDDRAACFNVVRENAKWYSVPPPAAAPAAAWARSNHLTTRGPAITAGSTAPGSTPNQSPISER